MKFMIAGLGSIGRRHFRNLLALGQQDILLYRTHQATLPDDELVGFPVLTDLNGALLQKPDAVIVSNPTALHLDVAIPAAQAGCHLLLEKPISHSLDRVDALMAATRQTHSRVLVGFQFRYHPGLQRIRQLLAEMAIGRPLSGRVHWGEYLPNWHPWEDYRKGYAARAELGGGVVLTLCHPLDYLHWLFGNVQSLWAFTGRNSGLELNVEDTAEIGLRFTSGMIASLHLNYIQRPSTHWMEIVGSQGTIRWDNADGAVHLYQASIGTWEHFDPPEGFERNQMFLAMMRHFLAVVGGEKPNCPLEDGIYALRLALATYRSAEQGCMVHIE